MKTNVQCFYIVVLTCLADGNSINPESFYPKLGLGLTSGNY